MLLYPPDPSALIHIVKYISETHINKFLMKRGSKRCIRFSSTVMPEFDKKLVGLEISDILAVV
jgi:hypothetical protein